MLSRTVPEAVHNLQRAGIAYDDAVTLRKIAMTLHRWHELECGDSDNYKSWGITRGHAPKRQFYRDPETQAPQWRTIGEFTYADDGAPYIETHLHSENKPRYTRIADREAGAKRRLARILKNYPHLSAYIQTDPRGCALYILRPGDVPTGADVSSCYSRGVAVYK
jgi:hypothetical protein